MEHQTGEICDSIFESEEEELAGQAFVESLAVKAVILLGIPDIIARHGPKATLSLSQISSELPSKKPDVDSLFRILRFLVAKNFFRAETSEGAVEVKYGLTPASKWFLKDGAAAPPVSLATTLLLQNDETANRRGIISTNVFSTAACFREGSRPPLRGVPDRAASIQ